MRVRKTLYIFYLNVLSDKLTCFLSKYRDCPHRTRKDKEAGNAHRRREFSLYYFARNQVARKYSCGVSPPFLYVFLIPRRWVSEWMSERDSETARKQPTERSPFANSELSFASNCATHSIFFGFRRVVSLKSCALLHALSYVFFCLSVSTAHSTARRPATCAHVRCVRRKKILDRERTEFKFEKFYFSGGTEKV